MCVCMYAVVCYEVCCSHTRQASPASLFLIPRLSCSLDVFACPASGREQRAAHIDACRPRFDIPVCLLQCSSGVFCWPAWQQADQTRPKKSKKRLSTRKEGAICHFFWSQSGLFIVFFSEKEGDEGRIQKTERTPWLAQNGYTINGCTAVYGSGRV